MSLGPLRTFRIVAQKAHQRAADWIRLLLLQPMTGAIKQSVFLHSRASARSHHIDGARSHVHCPVTFSTKESRWHIYGAPGLDSARQAIARGNTPLPRTLRNRSDKGSV